MPSKFQPNKIWRTSAKWIQPLKNWKGFLIVKTILRQNIPATRITYRDSQSYFAIFLDDTNRKVICRLYLNGGKKFIGLFDENKKETKNEIETLDDFLNIHQSFWRLLKYTKSKK